MSGYQIRRDQHYTRVLNLQAELRGVIEGACGNVDAGRWTAEQALTAIREKNDKTTAAIKASFAELQDGTR